MTRNQRRYQANRESHKAQVKARYDAYAGWLVAYKLEQGCNQCGYAEHSAALDLHHREGKSFALSHGYKYSRERVLAEVEKCEVLCANCHRVLHASKVRAGNL